MGKLILFAVNSAVTHPKLSYANIRTCILFIEELPKLWRKFFNLFQKYDYYEKVGEFAVKNDKWDFFVSSW